MGYVNEDESRCYCYIVRVSFEVSSDYCFLSYERGVRALLLEKWEYYWMLCSFVVLFSIASCSLGPGWN